MKSGLGTIEKNIKNHLDLVIDVEKKGILDTELQKIQQLTKEENQQENLEEVSLTRSKRITY